MALTLSIDDAVPLSADAADLAGSPQRFHAVVDRHFDAVAAYLARRVGPDTAEDLAQEVFVTAFRKRHRFDASFASARPWLLGIANKAIAGHRRAEQRQLELYRRVATEPERRETVRADFDPDLFAGLTALNRRDRDALLLHVWGELAYEEIALVLDVPVGTVRSRIHRARRQLTAHLGGTR
jgi:RNA polymerase sigma factor (sigma-70 family)